MKNKTLELKSQLNKCDSLEQKLAILKDAYLNEDCYILTAGPSINDINKDELNNKLKDKLVLCVKQTILKVPDICDFHIINPYNYQNYSFPSEATIKVNLISEDEKLKCPNYDPDLIFLINKDLIGKHTEALATKCNFGNFKLDKEVKRPWGPGIMYELVFYLAIHLGCKKIYTLGWDLGSVSTNKITRFYEKRTIFENADTYIKNRFPAVYNKYILKIINKYLFILFMLGRQITINKPGITTNEAIYIAESTYTFYLWLNKQNIDLFIISDKSMVDTRIPRAEF